MPSTGSDSKSMSRTAVDCFIALRNRTSRKSLKFPLIEPVSMASQSLSARSTWRHMYSANSPLTSSCRFMKRPCSTSRPPRICVGTTGSKIHLRAIQFVARPTTTLPATKVQGLGKNMKSTICTSPRRAPKKSPLLTRKSSSLAPTFLKRSTRTDLSVESSRTTISRMSNTDLGEWGSRGGAHTFMAFGLLSVNFSYRSTRVVRARLLVCLNSRAPEKASLKPKQPSSPLASILASRV
mmetsp:Transcript_4894/g.11522  ORF Transcript_4894/g.11522 Transcript_4894/m.11522 type:complete len:238 (-) Transcript_4894:17-730(-)